MQNSHLPSEAATMEEKAAEPPGNMTATPKKALPRQAKALTSRPRSSGRWNDWQWQIRNRIRSPEQLAAYVPTFNIKGTLRQVIERYPMAITPYYATLISKAEISDPVFLMSVPDEMELIDPPCLTDDPLEENKDMPVPGLIHRYRDRALLMATTMCAMYCRHCTRKRIAGTRETSISARRLSHVVAYLNTHPEISDVIISGGDPLTMPDNSLSMILSALRSVPSVEVLRIGTRVPVVLPMRITDELVSLLRKYHPLWINTHFNHPAELTEQARQACAKLANAGIPLGNQTVLLRGVNDTPAIIEQLCRELVKSRVRPYYLYQCDLVRGVEHFRTSLRKGIEIMEYMRGRVSGMAIPTFVVDARNGGGKIPVLPNYMVALSQSHTVLRNYEGMFVNYPEPGAERTPALTTQPGVWELTAGQATTILPAGTQRLNRRSKIKARPEACEPTDFPFSQA